MECKAVCLLLAFAQFALGKTDESPFVLLSPEMVNEINSLNAGYDSFFFKSITTHSALKSIVKLRNF